MTTSASVSSDMSVFVLIHQVQFVAAIVSLYMWNAQSHDIMTKTYSSVSTFIPVRNQLLSSYKLCSPGAVI